MTTLPLLGALDMARFTARGFLRFDAAVPDDINAQFLEEVGEANYPAPGQGMLMTYGGLLAKTQIPEVAPGAPLSGVYPQGSAVDRLLALPLVAGAIRSLVGPDPIFDHHFLHVTFPPAYYEAGGGEHVSQHTHQDSTIDPSEGFDLQIMYYPHQVIREMGGTRFVPGTHLRRVSEVALGRYQNIAGQQHVVCKAGALLFLHNGIWHGGGVNHSDRTRTMFKIRMNPRAPQVRQWDVSTLPAEPAKRPIFFRKSFPPETVESILMTPEPWFEQDTGRLEYVNRIKLWRRLSGDPAFDADYWLTRLENPARA
ncbi:phytanoyl-CoA dioxygenase family protein [Phenylobacterium sp.]|uniref:phytanoyl-CoA dioxygenase family protein n=1 Tax=Phenylobacterium sp. TaxID=1871053 RepID=UPI0011FDA9AD|nr:phytanoyl-CoA dioxygenase family protein [Phenylobacterium sp.]THD64759.1 MAG: phytanoyl-CoA dioxygenase [Phenylobacterium sp.]